MDAGKKLEFVYESKNKAEGPKRYVLTPKWWLSGSTLRLFQADKDGEGKRFHVADIVGVATVVSD